MTEWHRRWNDGKIGFHKDEVNPTLVEHIDVLGDAPGTVLVPLCGKTVDLTYLAGRGFRPIGVELVEKAAEQYFDERGLEAEVEGAARRAAGVEIVIADIFAYEPRGPVDAIWDRAAMIALPEAERAVYAARVIEWLRPGGVLLLLTFDYDASKMDGPPFAVTDDEVRAHYAAHGTLERLSGGPADGPKRMEELGLKPTESAWRFTRA